MASGTGTARASGGGTVQLRRVEEGEGQLRRVQEEQVGAKGSSAPLLYMKAMSKRKYFTSNYIHKPIVLNCRTELGLKQLFAGSHIHQLFRGGFPLPDLEDFTLKFCLVHSPLLPLSLQVLSEVVELMKECWRDCPHERLSSFTSNTHCQHSPPREGGEEGAHPPTHIHMPFD